jgi:hypothetical protein
MFAKNRGDDDASLFSSKIGGKFGRNKKSPSPTPIEVDVVTTTTVAAPVLPEDLSSPSSGRTLRTSGKSKSKSKQPAIAPIPSPITEENDDEREEEEERDEAPPSNPDIPFPADPVGVRASTLMLETETSASADEQSFEAETVDQSSGEDASNCFNESVLSATEEDEEEEEEEEEVSEEGTLDDNEKSYASGSDLEDGVTQQEQDNTTAFSARSVGTAKGNAMSKKYFHKDVVLNSLEDGMNSLVIRAMYFIPKPKVADHVVVKIEVSVGLTDDPYFGCLSVLITEIAHISYPLVHRHPPFLPVTV